MSSQESQESQETGDAAESEVVTERRGPTQRWLLEVDHGACVSSGMCVGLAPAAFELTSARQSSPKAAEIDADDAVLDAAENCPAEAITITDAVTGAAVFPPAD